MKRFGGDDDLYESGRVKNAWTVLVSWGWSGAISFFNITNHLKLEWSGVRWGSHEILSCIIHASKSTF